MGWFNLYGLIFVAVIMIPNIVFAAKCKDGFENVWKNKFVEAVEQTGRFACFILMVFNVPFLTFGFWFENALTVYLVADGVLVALYCIVWIILFIKPGILRALCLSVLPSVLFLFSGIIITSIPLIVAALVFAPSHIVISYKNARISR